MDKNKKPFESSLSRKGAETAIELMPYLHAHLLVMVADAEEYPDKKDESCSILGGCRGHLVAAICAGMDAETHLYVVLKGAVDAFEEKIGEEEIERRLGAMVADLRKEKLS